LALTVTVGYAVHGVGERDRMLSEHEAATLWAGVPEDPYAEAERQRPLVIPHRMTESAAVASAPKHA
jgi:hypothetical protein